MEKTFFSGQKKLGIIGGGQLGKMLLSTANQWDIYTKVLDPDSQAPARNTCNEFVQGSLLDFDNVYQFGKDCDVLTIEIEHVNTAALKKLEQEGKIVHPNPSSLETIQDKGTQKQFFEKHHLPTSNFQIFQNKQEIIDKINQGTLPFPFVQKTRKAGYDGRGVQIIHSIQEIDKLFEQESLIEDKVDILYEIAIICVRNKQGDIECFDPVLMDFHEEANMLDLLLYPAPIELFLIEKAKDLAKKLIELLDISGLLAVEFLIDTNQQIFINEVAPRPHNSGHQTIESCISSQYEQHIRGILNLPLGSTQLIVPSAMVNLLGAKGFSGNVYYEGIENCLSQEGIHIHIYGKKQTKPFRKMGHVTVTNKDIQQAKNTAIWVRQNLIVKSL
ncbi:MAG TPA: 5-(carboxyamino)imidazole ribonucleotide synthase [Chitinophagaceae bacterium]|nr:MAG: phosphoribosylaminoimidazole carboxylase ATPase subunit [Bacteroidetes bacterium OLB11]HMN32845.1 5-(carboxyamino)imidazole ribonucleotide synthase [Chitinophagaceae bacterium]